MNSLGFVCRVAALLKCNRNQKLAALFRGADREIYRLLEKMCRLGIHVRASAVDKIIDNAHRAPRSYCHAMKIDRETKERSVP